MFLLYMDLPDRHESVSRSSAQEERAQGRCSGGEGFGWRGVRPAGPGGGRAGGRESRARFDAAAVGRAHCHGAGETDSSGTDGVRVEALSRDEVENRGRDFAYDGRDGEEHALSCHAEVAWGFVGYEIGIGGNPHFWQRRPEV